MAERNQKFWNSNELTLSTFEREWYTTHVNKPELGSRKYDMGTDELDGDMERTVGNHLALVGPMIDTYLLQIGRSIHAKLARNITGLAVPISIFIPWQIQRHINALCTGYGAEVKMVCKK